MTEASRPQTADPTDTRLSLVIPVRNEAGNIGPLLDEVFSTLPPALLGEVIVVDDGSSDATVPEVQARMSPRLRLIRHVTSAGQSRAIRSGVQAARFARIATLDGDGQNPPADLIALAAAQTASGPQLVGGHRVARRDRWAKRIASRLANGLRRMLLRDACPDTGCGLKVFPRDLYLDLPFFHGQHRYLPALMRAAGATAVYLPVGDRARRHGRSNYDNLRRGLQGAVDLIAVAWLIRRTRPVKAHEEALP
ncbi:MAG: glycosyl transferase [Rhodobacteraceae bacterium PARR1]|nr:MAG: glycosyl transferase [Rhodobacteraceae bacterium PARR1]